MLRPLLRFVVVSILVVAGSVARADDAAFDPTIDECAEPGAQCLPDALEPTEASVETAELAALAPNAPVRWQAAPDQVACPEGSTNQGGHCTPDASTVADVDGGCMAAKLPGLLVVCAVIGLMLWARRRRGLLVVLAACSFDGGTYDDAVDQGPTGDTDSYIAVYSADLGDGDGVQFLLANQALAQGAQQPEQHFSLMREKGAVPVFRVSGRCGDQLVTSNRPGAELLGWGRDDAGDGTAELVELAAPDGCAVVYETDPETITQLVAQGYQQRVTIANVWPPGIGDPAPTEPTTPDPGTGSGSGTAPSTPACTVDASSPLQLLYASPGATETLRFLIDCPGEVVVGEKRQAGPIGSMADPAAKAAGGRTAFVIDRNGDMLRQLLMRTNGVERTAQFIRDRLQAGYDYIVIDEITAAPDFRDGQTLNLRLRQLLQRVPPRTIIPYLSIDLMQYPNGLADLKARRLLVRAFYKTARMIALEVYMHTAQVKGGGAPLQFRRAADRLALAVRGLSGTTGINRRAISTIATSIHGGSANLAQYSYLDMPSYDLRSIQRQVNAIRLGSKRTRQQRGVGWYFVNKSDMAPHPGGYSYDALIKRMRLQGLRFK